MSLFQSVFYSTLPAVFFLRMGELGGGENDPPLKIFNNDVKRLKVVPNLGKKYNFLDIYQKKSRDQNF